ncbi:hypothetical protein F4V43_15290 [Paenibacillus spiritus]|uniref:Uncharacterized protein n=1 Tax=Paenibacillus spiritus TaxID=2496557 RepID=A0A5J5G020_9BACL|nr:MULTISPECIES: hypothetical protein [Paenibacillus]KAA8999693.1 hypothetical protein F4V43_15290 [Paenibacillus spiritus]
MKFAAKMVLTSLLSTAIVLSASPAMAVNPERSLLSESDSHTRYPYYNHAVLGTPSVILPAYTIPAHYGWVKVWVKNKGEDTITVTVTQGTEAGPIKMQFKVPPGKMAYKIASSPWSTGPHVVSATPSQGYAVNALLTVKLASTEEAIRENTNQGDSAPSAEKPSLRPHH